MLYLIRSWRKRYRCFHHDHIMNWSWVGRGTIIDYRKRYECSHCHKVWII